MSFYEVTAAGADFSFIEEGTVFVMNEKGATVSRWDLGPSDVPLTVTNAATMQKPEPTALELGAALRGNEASFFCQLI